MVAGKEKKNLNQKFSGIDGNQGLHATGGKEKFLKEGGLGQGGCKKPPSCES